MKWDYLLTGQSLIERWRFCAPLLDPFAQPATNYPALYTGEAGFSFPAADPGLLGFLTPNDH